MEEVIRVLWEYASKYRLDGFYNRDAYLGREECAEAIIKNREELERICPSCIFKQVDALCDCSEELRQRDMEAAFACGFRLGTALR